MRPRRHEGAWIVAVRFARGTVLDVVLDVPPAVIDRVGARAEAEEAFAGWSVEADPDRLCRGRRRGPQRDHPSPGRDELEGDVAPVRLDGAHHALAVDAQVARPYTAVPARRVAVAQLDAGGLGERRLAGAAELDAERLGVDSDGQRTAAQLDRIGTGGRGQRDGAHRGKCQHPSDHERGSVPTRRTSIWRGYSPVKWTFTAVRGRSAGPGWRRRRRC